MNAAAGCVAACKCCEAVSRDGKLYYKTIIRNHCYQ